MHVKESGLFEAAKAGWLPEIRKHIGLEPHLLEAFSDDGLTPLALASSHGHYTIVKYLLEMGASPQTRVKTGSNSTSLHLAVKQEHLPVVKLLIGHGADINAKEKDDIAPLHLAVQTGNLNMVRLLVKHHAHVKTIDANGKKPIDYAKSSRKDEIVRFLSQYEKE